MSDKCLGLMSTLQSSRHLAGLSDRPPGNRSQGLAVAKLGRGYFRNSDLDGGVVALASFLPKNTQD